MNRFLNALLIMISLVTPLLSQDSPKDLGFRFPDEWEARQGTMMIFPARHQYGRELSGFRREFVALAKAIAENEPVIVFCPTADLNTCKQMLGEVPNLTIRAGNFSIDWARDNAPILLRNPEGKLAAAAFLFNGWGRKYPGWNEVRLNFFCSGN